MTMDPDNRVVRIIAERPEEYELPNPIHAFDDVEDRDSVASMVAAGIIGWGVVIGVVFVILFFA